MDLVRTLICAIRNQTERSDSSPEAFLFSSRESARPLLATSQPFVGTSSARSSQSIVSTLRLSNLTCCLQWQSYHISKTFISQYAIELINLSCILRSRSSELNSDGPECQQMRYFRIQKFRSIAWMVAMAIGSSMFLERFKDAENCQI